RLATGRCRPFPFPTPSSHAVSTATARGEAVLKMECTGRACRRPDKNGEKITTLASSLLHGHLWMRERLSLSLPLLLPFDEDTGAWRDTRILTVEETERRKVVSLHCEMRAHFC
uniref:Uncharacterized protein n=1 Tax=Pristionchus pacificus TaxID=54126 RepID=A0A2A6BGQ0_PRIPA